MNRQQFNSNNNKGEVLTFQKSGSTPTFNPSVNFNIGSKRSSWRLNNGTNITQIAGNSLSYTGFTSDTNLRNIELRCASLNNVTLFFAQSDNLYGELDLSELNSLNSINVISNNGLTGVTLSPSANLTLFDLFNCNLIGQLDLSYLSGLGGAFSVALNQNLTGITNPTSNTTFTRYEAWNCNLNGNLDLSMLTNLGGKIVLFANPNLTGVTLSPTFVNFTEYSINNCDIIGNHDISSLINLGGTVSIYSNPQLTGITFTTGSTRPITIFRSESCDIQGTLDLSVFSGFGSTTSGATSQIKINANSGVTDFIFPVSNGFYYKNIANNITNAAFGMYSCSLGYVDFKPLSGSTLISGATGIPRFELFGNGMTTTDVNHILSDLDLISDLNYTGWTSTSGTSAGYLDITGNSVPDGTSGGYNGTGATINLISKGWTILTD